MNSSESAEQRWPESRFELIELASVNDPRNYFACVERLSGISRYDAIDFAGVITGHFRRRSFQPPELAPIEVANDATHSRECIVVVLSEVVCDTG